MSAVDYVIMATKSDCYKTGATMKPTHIVVHSTGCANPNLKRYIQPDNGSIGVNPYNNSMNEPNQNVCVNALIGLDKNGSVKTVQCLPWYFKAWGVYKGDKGSFNDCAIQFEICEDDLSSKTYCRNAYNKAVELCAYLCKEYNIPVKNVVSHKEVGEMGYGSKHIDPMNWWGKYGYTMDGFRTAVQKKIDGTDKPILDKTGYKSGDNTIGALALKELLLIAKQLGLHKYGMDENTYVGKGTINAINSFLDKWGYAKNSIAGANFIMKLTNDIKNKLKK